MTDRENTELPAVFFLLFFPVYFDNIDFCPNPIWIQDFSFQFSFRVSHTY